MAGVTKFQLYLKRAVDLALQEEISRDDGGMLQNIHELCRRGVLVNHTAITPQGFLADYLWVVSSIQMKFSLNEMYHPRQMELFHQCNAADIVANADAIRATWTNERCLLNEKKFKAIMSTAYRIAKDWPAFKEKYLRLPCDPTSESPDDWEDVVRALDRLPMIGEANTWYLIRNLYGGPFLKPDVHINAIVDHFFGGNQDAMVAAIKKLWPVACTDPRFTPVHIGEVDYISFGGIAEGRTNQRPPALHNWR